MSASHLGNVARRSPVEVFSLLNAEAISYKIIRHRPVYTCSEAAQARQVPLHHELKSLLVICDSGLVLLNLPGDMQINRQRVRRALPAHNFRLANLQEMRKLRVTTGTVSPLGLTGCRSLLDKEVLRIDWITTNAGRLTLGLRIAVCDLTRICKFEVAELAADKP